MPFYERGDVRIHYKEAGTGFPLLVIPGGGLKTIEAVQGKLVEPVRVPPSMAAFDAALAARTAATAGVGGA